MIIIIKILPKVKKRFNREWMTYYCILWAAYYFFLHSNKQTHVVVFFSQITDDDDNNNKTPEMGVVFPRF